MQFLKRISDRFLVKTIMSRQGELHFRRWCLLSTERGDLYLHEIRRSDQDRDPHDHPWNFWSLILWGGYREMLITLDPEGNQIQRFNYCGPGKLLRRHFYEFHQIRLFDEDKPTWTLVWVSKRVNDPWGYLTAEGWVDNIQYRKNKNGT